jgi:hypothetical protein
MRERKTHMFAKLTGLAYVGMSLITIKSKIKRTKSLQKIVADGVSAPLMLELDIIGSGMKSLGRVKVEWIEVAIAVTSEHLHVSV